MKVAVTGSSGLVGRALVERLESERHEVQRLVRPGAPPGSGQAFWDPAKGTIDAGALERLGAVVHRPSFGFAPAWFLKLAAGPDKAREVLLSSQRAIPEKLLATGFSFRHSSIDEGLRSAL